MIAGLPTKNGAIHVKDVQDRFFYAKTQACPKIPGTENPTWLANELIFYSIARDSALNVPFSAIIEVDHKLCWGSQYVLGRNALRKQESEGGEILRTICEESKHQLLGLARALLLDVALLNSDRKPWNVLVSRNGGSKDLYYFDHDKTLLGDGREPSANPAGDLGRIDAASVVDSKVRDYLACNAANRVVLRCLSDNEVRDVFDSLSLNADSMEAAKNACPKAWLSEDLYSRLRKFLLEWWKFLRAKLHGGAPRDYLTQALSNSSRP
jgi:hypothetical protein